MRKQSRWLPLAAAAAASVAACSSQDDPPPPGGNELAARLKQDTGGEWFVDVDPSTKTPRFVEPDADGAVVLAPGASAEAAARAWLTKYKDYFGIQDPGAELELEGEERGLLDFVHVAFRQKTRGVEVDGTRVGVHFDKAGHVAFVTGPFAPAAREVDAKPSLDPAAASRAALGALPPGAAVDPGSPAPVLLVDPFDKVLLYRVRVSAMVGGRVAAYDYYVDAKTGAIKRTRSALRRATVTMTATGQAASYAIEIDAPASGRPYRLSRAYTSAKPNKPALHVRNAAVASSPVFESQDGQTWDQAGSDPGAAVDAFANFSIVESFYRSRLFMLSYDNNPRSELNVRMHAGSSFNASWNPALRLFEIEDGTAPSKTYSFAASLDVMAHEFQHAVTEHYLGLRYENQSGAMNEALSDIFGAFVDRFAEAGGGDPSTIAETSTSPVLRDMSDPRASDPPQPDRMSAAVSSPNTEAGDWGGVHMNSGIPNKAFSMMTVGGTHASTNVHVAQPLGYEASLRLWWEVVRGRVVSAGATFQDLANATIAIARRSGREALSAAVCAWVSVEVVDAKTAKSRWNITCDPPRVSCVDNGTTCTDGKVCAWNGQSTGYCCRVAEVGEQLCLGDAECPQGQVCTAGPDDMLYCRPPVSGDDTCERPPGAAQQGGR
jgi:bacillolysin/thermolysin